MNPDDLFELEAEMSGASRWGSEWDAKVERAKARAEAFVRKAHEAARYKEWERTPLLDRLRHALHGTLPDTKARR